MEQRLSRITTCWSKVFEAHRGGQDTVASAKGELLERYCGAIYRYAVAALRDPDAAEEVLQEFAYCFVRGDFRGANPDRGRFRDFVKTVLVHLVVNYQRQRGKLARQQPLAAVVDVWDSNQDTPPEAVELDFIKLWREELLERTWAALDEDDRSTQSSFYKALRRRAEQPNVTSDQLAELLTAETGRSFTADGVRQTLHRAREKFANLLIDEIGKSLETTEHGAIEQELIDLDLLPYCKSTLRKRFPDRP
jgi:RNA polymerase sigma-70 factor (ECF subfamily)